MESRRLDGGNRRRAGHASISGQFSALFTWDADAQAFNSFHPTLPPSLNTLNDLRLGDGVWVQITDPSGAYWEQPAFSASRSVSLLPGFNLVMWTGPDGTAVPEAVAGLGDALGALFT